VETKVTLKLEQEVVQKAKGLAKARRTSLSKLVEDYLQKITNEDEEISPITKSLSGVINLQESEYNKNNYSDFLINKYE
jgi:metal-responsive CopG/Arc/MetJ family transcriptional regulator